MNEKIVIKGLKQNNLKDISIEIPKNKIVVFTGVSGGDVVFTGSPKDMIEKADTITAKCLKYSVENVKLSEEQLAELTRIPETDSDIEFYKKENGEEGAMKLEETEHAGSRHQALSAERGQG